LTYDSVLFDFDGVLADTEPIHWACWVETLTPFEIELTWETYCANCIGIADLNMLVFLASLSSRPIDAESLQEANPCSPETVELIRSLLDYRIAVVTSSGRLEVEPLLDGAGIRQHLGAVVFGEDVQRHKPAPDPYLLGAARLGSSRPLVVEDSDAGVASARAAGFDFVKVNSPAEVVGDVRTRLRLGR
jgi:beta-phosphoglucomutase